MFNYGYQLPITLRSILEQYRRSFWSDDWLSNTIFQVSTNHYKLEYIAKHKPIDYNSNKNDFSKRVSPEMVLALLVSFPPVNPPWLGMRN